jgi:hypothetical protein
MHGSCHVQAGALALWARYLRVFVAFGQILVPAISALLIASLRRCTFRLFIQCLQYPPVHSTVLYGNKCAAPATMLAIFHIFCWCTFSHPAFVRLQNFARRVPGCVLQLYGSQRSSTVGADIGICIPIFGYILSWVPPIRSPPPCYPPSLGGQRCWVQASCVRTAPVCDQLLYVQRALLRHVVPFILAFMHLRLPVFAFILTCIVFDLPSMSLSTSLSTLV